MSVTKEETRMALLEKGVLAEYVVERDAGAHLVGSVYKGKVSRILQGIQAAFIDIGLHNDGLAHISKLSKDYLKHPSDLFSVGDIVDCYVIDIKKDQEKVSLSLLEE